VFSLTKKTDYALLALTCLGLEPAGRALNTKVIAERYQIPSELLAKILQQLARRGLVESSAGPTGGYRLALAASEITVADVMNAVDGRPALVQCFKNGRTACSQFECCTIRNPLALVQRRLSKVLRETTLRDLVNAEAEAQAPVSRGAGQRVRLTTARADACAEE
jgi:Rrf2 family protein